jgi:hypothetical protein
MTKAFLWLPLALVATPWKYVLYTYVLNRKRRRQRKRDAPLPVDETGRDGVLL